jgi:acetyl esterase/lipase
MPGYLIYNNFLSPYWSGLDEQTFPEIPANIDIVAFDSYWAPGPDSEDAYKAHMGEDIAIIQDRAGMRPVVFGTLAYRVDHDGDGVPDSQPQAYQVGWDVDLVLEHNLAGLRWFFYDDYAPPTWYGASYWPDVLAAQEQAGLALLGEIAPTPTPVPPTPTIVPGEPVHIYDIPYGPDPAHMLDVHLPPGDGPFPVVLWLHGGGLTTGDKSWAQWSPFVGAGMALVSANYRLCPDAWMPAQIDDAKAAVRWIHDHAGEYGFGNVGVIGGSAGAFLAASMETEDVDIQAAVPMAGIYNFPAYFAGAWNFCEDKLGQEQWRDNCYIQWFFGCSLVDQWCRDNMVVSSAVTHVSADDPPVMVMIGSLDETPRGLQDHQELHDALVQAGVDSTLVIVPGARHGDVFGMRTEQIVGFFLDRLE